MGYSNEADSPTGSMPAYSATLDAYQSTGNRWFILGVMLLAVMAAAVFTVRHDPMAIAALFFAIAAVLRTVPPIIDARQRLIRGSDSSNCDQAASAEMGDCSAL